MELTVEKKSFFRRKSVVLVVIVLILLFIFFLSQTQKPPTSIQLQNTELLDTFMVEGTEYELYENGNLYQKNSGTFVTSYYDPVAYANKYTYRDGDVFVRSETNEYKLYTTLSDSFENIQHFRDLISYERAWTAFTLQSPQAKGVSDYAALRRCILDTTCDFKDNRIDISDDQIHSGTQSLKFYAVAPSLGITTSKSSLESTLMYFKKGDDIWFSGWFYIEKGMPSTLVDIENEDFLDGPGPRLIFRNGYLSVELKARNKPQYNQKVVTFPKNQWVHVVEHLKLSEQEDGVIEVWQDGTKIIDTLGPNLPTVNSILNRLEIGITATQEETILYVDNIKISDRPFTDITYSH